MGLLDLPPNFRIESFQGSEPGPYISVIVPGMPSDRAPVVALFDESITPSEWHPDPRDDTIVSEGYRAGQAHNNVYGFLNPVPFGLSIRKHTIDHYTVYSIQQKDSGLYWTTPEERGEPYGQIELCPPIDGPMPYFRQLFHIHPRIG